MKKISTNLMTTLVCLCLSLSLSSCFDIAEKAAKEPKNLVYANSHDGFLNIRQEPTANSAIVGRIYNGDEGVEDLGSVIGNWMYVSNGNTTGWIHTGYVQRTPSSPALLDNKKLHGVWVAMTSTGNIAFATLLFFDDGTYVEGGVGLHLGGAGRWTLQDGKLTLEQCFHMQKQEKERLEKGLVVVRENTRKMLLDGKSGLIYHKEPFISDRASRDDYMGRLSRNYYIKAHEDITPYVK